MNMNWFMRIMKYMLSLIHYFYFGIIAVILLLMGIFNPFFRMVGLLVLVLWLILAAIDQAVLNKVMQNNPELQEIVNSVMANETGLERVPVGTEVTFCSIEGEERSLVGRCLNEEAGDWNIRLLYEGSYQMFDWNMVYNEQFLPQMKCLREMTGHEEDILVKCYCKEPDGKARWQLHLLKRDGAIYKDIVLDMINLIGTVEQAYKMEYIREKSLICLECDRDDNPAFSDRRISIDNSSLDAAPINMVYGNVVLIDMDQMKVKLSVGVIYERMGIGQPADHYVVGLADHYVVGNVVIGEDDIKVGGIHIES